ncbi:hypothetical protein DT603_11660 [Pseudoxanthomonas gei]|uniref:Uncharacterized protein n=1 Tax=Pseudoxanthomonas gei TaxID=1383030 RepID=A0ABX0AD36_9GAMM|nr:hypothetical protein [Pseudoxanthomonas gei]NDK39499.1 hypothetical protein [Pseudoxanthomonas gei]
MKTSTYNSWWREMGAISRGMMFIEGNIATPAALDLGGRRPAPRPSRRRTARHPRKGFSLYEDLLFLGGRPMTAGHNDDSEEAFPQTGAEAARAAHAGALHPVGNNGSHVAATHASGSARTRHLLQAIALLLLVAATAWAFGPTPTASVVELPAVSAQPAVAAAPSSIRIVDLPAVTVRPQPEDYALLAAENIRSVECLAC